LVYKIIRRDPRRRGIHLARILLTMGHPVPLRNRISLLQVSRTLQNDTRFISSTTETLTSSAVRTIAAPSSASMANGSFNTPQSCLVSYHKTSFIEYLSPTVGLRFLGMMIRWNSPLCSRCCISNCGCLILFRTRVCVESTCRLPFGSNRPPFREFSSLLRLSTKYQIDSIHDMLLASLRAIFSPGQDAGVTPIYHKYFEDPQPHPNEVLKLFHECRVDFALPFAFYEACVAGIKSLTNTDPSIKLASVPLSQAVRGFYTLQEWEWRLARGILFLDRQSHTSSRCRPLDLRSTDSGSPLQDVLRAVYPGFGAIPGGILHILDFPGGDNCADCVRRWNDMKQQAKVELWKTLPEIFGMEPWAEIYSKGSRAT